MQLGMMLESVQFDPKAWNDWWVLLYEFISSKSSDIRDKFFAINKKMEVRKQEQKDQVIFFQDFLRNQARSEARYAKELERDAKEFSELKHARILG